MDDGVTEPVWREHDFGSLGLRELYAILAARSEVFVVEQDCVFLDIDGRDDNAWHLTGWSPDGKLWAYARILGPGGQGPEPSIGRVLTTRIARGRGLGWPLMHRAMDLCRRLHGPGPVRVAAQQRLRDFYASLGFEAVGDPYDEDGILHQDMIREG